MKLVLTQTCSDWFCIERAKHDNTVSISQEGAGMFSVGYSGRICNADVEGTAEEMLAIATAIEARGDEWFKRCAVEVEDRKVFLWSPRNATYRGEVSLAEADELAVLIRKQLGSVEAK